MTHLGMSEILVIFVVAVVLFGYKKLPDVGKSLGRGIRNFKRSMHEPDEVVLTPPEKEPGNSKNEQD